MRLAIIAGLIMGLSLGVNSTLAARARSIAAHAANIRPAHVCAPWYIATDKSAGTHGRSAA
jgi:hypothetical protein